MLKSLLYAAAAAAAAAATAPCVLNNGTEDVPCTPSFGPPVAAAFRSDAPLVFLYALADCSIESKPGDGPAVVVVRRDPGCLLHPAAAAAAAAVPSALFLVAAAGQDDAETDLVDLLPCPLVLVASVADLPSGTRLAGPVYVAAPLLCPPRGYDAADQQRAPASQVHILRPARPGPVRTPHRGLATR